MQALRTILRRASCSVSELARFVLPWLVAGCAYVPGCQPSTSAITLIDVTERSPEMPAGLELDKKALEIACRDAIGSLDGFEFRAARGGESEWQLTARLAFVTERSLEKAGHIHRAVGLKLKLHKYKSKEGEAPQTYETQSLVTEDVPRTKRAEGLVVLGIRKGISQIAFELVLEGASASEVVTALGSADDLERIVAIEVARRRGLAEAVPKLIEMIGDEKRSVLEISQVIGALTELGDRRAVEPLIDAVRGRSVPFMRQVLFALGQLGGRTAGAYLFTVQSGHRDPEVRAAAKDALKELERRQPPAPQ